KPSTRMELSWLRSAAVTVSSTRAVTIRSAIRGASDAPDPAGRPVAERHLADERIDVHGPEALGVDRRSRPDGGRGLLVRVGGKPRLVAGQREKAARESDLVAGPCRYALD